MKASRPPPAGPIIINQYMLRGQSQIKRVQPAGGRAAYGEREEGHAAPAALVSAPWTATAPSLSFFMKRGSRLTERFDYLGD